MKYQRRLKTISKINTPQVNIFALGTDDSSSNFGKNEVTLNNGFPTGSIVKEWNEDYIVENPDTYPGYQRPANTGNTGNTGNNNVGNSTQKDNSGLAGGIMAASGSLNQLIGNMLNQASIKDPEAMKDNYRAQLGGLDTSSFDALNASKKAKIANVSASDFTNMTKGAGVLNGISAGDVGATAGNAIVPGWGALVGGVLGTGTSIIGTIRGRRKARRAVKPMNDFIKEVNTLNNMNFVNQNNNLLANQVSSLEANYKAEGGFLNMGNNIYESGGNMMYYAPSLDYQGWLAYPNMRSAILNPPIPKIEASSKKEWEKITGLNKKDSMTKYLTKDRAFANAIQQAAAFYQVRPELIANRLAQENIGNIINYYNKDGKLISEYMQPDAEASVFTNPYAWGYVEDYFDGYKDNLFSFNDPKINQETFLNTDNFTSPYELAALYASSLRKGRDQMRKKFPNLSEYDLDRAAQVWFNRGEKATIKSIENGLLNDPREYAITVKMPDWERIEAQQANQNSVNTQTYAYGGQMGKHSNDFSNGLVSINNGGSHEMNPNQGVQIGVDNQGTPNLVEEGETVFGDFVFSNRITVPKEVLSSFGIKTKKKMTYADVSKHLAKESEERPNDQISQRGLERNLGLLSDAQEKQKMQKDAEEKMLQALNAVNPNMPADPTMAMQGEEQLQEDQMQEEQMAQEQAMQEQAMQEQAMQEQMMQEQMAQQGGQPMVAAKGGFLKNCYAEGTNAKNTVGEKDIYYSYPRYGSNDSFTPEMYDYGVVTPTTPDSFFFRPFPNGYAAPYSSSPDIVEDYGWDNPTYSAASETPSSGINWSATAAKNAAGFLPVVGTVIDGYDMIQDPSWYNATSLGLSALGDLGYVAGPFTGGLTIPAAQVAKAASAARRVKNALRGTSGRVHLNRKYRDLHVKIPRINMPDVVENDSTELTLAQPSFIGMPVDATRHYTVHPTDYTDVNIKAKGGDTNSHRSNVEDIEKKIQYVTPGYTPASIDLEGLSKIKLSTPKDPTYAYAEQELKNLRNKYARPGWITPEYNPDHYMIEYYNEPHDQTEYYITPYPTSYKDNPNDYFNDDQSVIIDPVNGIVSNFGYVESLMNSYKGSREAGNTDYHYKTDDALFEDPNFIEALRIAGVDANSIKDLEKNPTYKHLTSAIKANPEKWAPFLWSIKLHSGATDEALDFFNPDGSINYGKFERNFDKQFSRVRFDGKGGIAHWVLGMLKPAMVRKGRHITQPSATATEETIAKDTSKGTKLKERKGEFLRYAGVLGDIGALAMATLSKPNYDNVDDYFKSLKGAYMPIEYNPIGGYLPYKPTDVNKMINDYNASTNATRRALMDVHAGNRGSLSGALTMLNNGHLANIGNAYIVANNANWEMLKDKEKFNRETAQTNAENFLKAATSNQSALASLQNSLYNAYKWKDDIYQKNKLAKVQAYNNLFSDLTEIGTDVMNANDNIRVINASGYGNGAQQIMARSKDYKKDQNADGTWADNTYMNTNQQLSNKKKKK